VVVEDNVSTRAGSTDSTVYATVLFGEGAFAQAAIAGIELMSLYFHDHQIPQPPFSAVAG
jgi:hypothetical protein